MSNQIFHRGDHVMIAKDLGPGMSHFTNDAEAIIQYSFRDKYDHGSGDHKYCIYIKGKGNTSWYEECYLTLIEKRAPDLLDQWEQADRKRRSMNASNGED